MIHITEIFLFIFRLSTDVSITKRIWEGTIMTIRTKEDYIDLLDLAHKLPNGETISFEGKVYVEPDEETLAKKKVRLQEENEKKDLLNKLKGKDNVTLDGQHINLYANIGNIKDLALVLKNDAGGIGLFRSEFIYLE